MSDSYQQSNGDGKPQFTQQAIQNHVLEIGDSPYFTCLKESSWKRVFCSTSLRSLGDPRHFLTPAFLLLLATMSLCSHLLFSLFQRGNPSSVPCSPGLSTNLTLGKSIRKRRDGQGMTAPELVSLRTHINACSPRLRCISDWVFTFLGASN